MGKAYESAALFVNDRQRRNDVSWRTTVLTPTGNTTLISFNLIYLGSGKSGVEKKGRRPIAVGLQTPRLNVNHVKGHVKYACNMHYLQRLSQNNIVRSAYNHLHTKFEESQSICVHDLHKTDDALVTASLKIN